MSQFNIIDTNPNDEVGGGGTLASGEVASEDAKGPFIIFPATETASNISPHAVLAYSTLEEIVTAVAAEQEPEVIDIPEEDVVEVPEV